MQTTDGMAHGSREISRTPAVYRRARHRRGWLTGGGTDGNERLTTTTGLVLILLLAVIGVTIIRMRQLTFVHLFVGLLLIGPVALKVASTGYRFMRYYTSDAPYRAKGPPEPLLRVIAPIVVLSTIGVFASGVILLFEGRAHRDPMLLIHKVSFIIWVAFTAAHVLGHIPEVVAHIPGLGDGSRARALRDSIPGLGPTGATDSSLGAPAPPPALPGGAGRSIALIGALVGGLILALVLIPDFGAWTHHIAGLGHDH